MDAIIEVRTTIFAKKTGTMSTFIKLIWDFRGSNAQPIAEHHRIHLEEFIKKEGLELLETGVHKMSVAYSIAYMHVSESEMLKVRDALKPHRGERITV
ncbi:MAG: hypothetical protein ACI9GM_001253 [Salibacteraceae bacterium]|jgi:hypothetical protein